MQNRKVEIPNYILSSNSIALGSKLNKKLM